MSYQFPRRVLRAQDVLDPIELTLDLAPAAERLSGRLNAHNFNQNIASLLDVDAAAFYRTRIYKKGVPFGDNHTATALEPWTGFADATVPADAFLVQNGFDWQAIGTAGDLSVVSLTTGQSVLWVHVFAQHLWYGFKQFFDDVPPSSRRGRQHLSNAHENPVNLHFAIRIDGSVIPETITGIDDQIYMASLPAKPLEQRNTDTPTVLPGPQDVRSQQICAIGPAAVPIRISAAIPVQAGDHTVELVVRRVPLQLFAETPDYTEFDQVYIFSRQVIVTELKSFPDDSTVAADVSVPAIEEEELLTNATMYVQRVQPLIAAYNDIQPGNLARGALMHYHLPATLRSTTTTREVFTTAFPGVKYNCVYPGFGSTTIAAAKYGGAPSVGWYMIEEGGTKAISAKNISIASASRLLITANLQIVDIDGGEAWVSQTEGSGGAAVYNAYCGGFAAFTLMWRITGSGNWVAIRESTALVNSYMWATDYEYAEVQLLAELPLGPVPATTIEVAVFGSVLNAKSSDLNPNLQQTEFAVRRGSIVVLSQRD